MVYNYMKEKHWLTTNMNIPPRNQLCELTVKDLGFKVNQKTSEDC